MSALTPVSFKTGRAHSPRLSAKRVPGRHSDRYWSDEEQAVLHVHYASDGAAACLARLPKRSIQMIYQQAAKLGLTYAGPGGGRKTRRRLSDRASLEEQVRTAWPMLKGRGSVQGLADRLGVPRDWVSEAALRLGLTMPHKKEPRWTEAENALMRKVPLHDVDRAAQIFRQHGFARTPTSIMVHAKRLNLSRRYSETLSATAAARILGYDGKTVAVLCGTGELKATRRATRRLPQQGGDAWSITHADLRQFVIDHLERIDFRRVDKFELVDLLVNAGSRPAVDQVEDRPEARP